MMSNAGDDQARPSKALQPRSSLYVKSRFAGSLVANFASQSRRELNLAVDSDSSMRQVERGQTYMTLRLSPSGVSGSQRHARARPRAEWQNWAVVTAIAQTTCIVERGHGYLRCCQSSTATVQDIGYQCGNVTYRRTGGVTTCPGTCVCAPFPTAWDGGWAGGVVGWVRC